MMQHDQEVKEDHYEVSTTKQLEYVLPVRSIIAWPHDFKVWSSVIPH